MSKKYLSILIFLFLILCCGQVLIAHPTNELTIQNNVDDKKIELEAFEGYTLFSPEFSTKTYLIDNDETIINSWSSNYVQGLPSYLLENGNMIRGCSKLRNSRFVAGGVTGRVEMHDWNNTQLWEFDYSTDNHCIHHDIEVLPNGNVLMSAWEYKTASEAIAFGRNPNYLQSNQLWPDSIIEVKPDGSNEGTIVWEWHVWDHLIQDYDPSKENYGDISEHPERIDINSGGRQADLNHINSIDYNDELDQIMLSSHNQNEIWIIDHSTTTEEAARNTGGRYDKGGDLLYRWGNPRVYGHGTENDQQLFGQHDAQWIETGRPGEKNILIFNNGQGRPDGKYSSIVEITPPINEHGFYNYTENNAYLPLQPIWEYTKENPEDFYASKISGAQRLPNGNTVICSGDDGYFFEVTRNGEIVWDYENIYPLLGKKSVFKIHKYSSDYPGIITNSNKPNTPSIPTGKHTGIINEEYVYSTLTTDPNNDQLYYLFDWNDGTNSSWIGPIKSGETAEASHIWSEKGSFTIRAKAKDESGLESEWSDALEITMPKSSFFKQEKLFSNLKIFQTIFSLINNGFILFE